MQSAVVIMSILGCSAQATDCVHLLTLDRRWSTVALCDLAAANELPKHVDFGYPVVVAVCETPEKFDESEDGHQGEMVTRDRQLIYPGDPPSPPAKPDEQAIRIMKKIQPDVSSIPGKAKDIPSRFVETIWSWVKNRLP